MGREALIEYAAGRERARVKAHLDSFALELRGEKKLKLPLSQVKTVTVEGDLLKVTTTTGDVRFTLKLGAKDAASWAKKILSPPTLADKLGVKSGLTIALVGKRIAEIDDAVAAATNVRHTAAPAAASLATADIAAVTLSPATAEGQIAAAAKAIGAKTALWLVYRKGIKPNGDDVIRFARAAGLKDTKVSRISETHAALRFIRAKG